MSRASSPISERPSHLATTALGAYLVAVVALAAWMLTSIFPSSAPPVNVEAPEARATTDVPPSGEASPPAPRLTFRAWTARGRILMPPLEPDQGLIVLALLAGALGAFMHAAQSFAAFVGNRELKLSWVWWYVLRPPIGSVLGLLLYFVARAGLLGGASDSVSPYGVVAIGGLGGWFSKQATNKLAEGFDTLFRTANPPEQKDPLAKGANVPTISEVFPSTIEVPEDETVSPSVLVRGSGFQPTADVTLDDEKLASTWKSSGEIAATIPRAKLIEPGTRLSLVVVNHTPEPRSSEAFVLTVKDPEAPPA